MFSHHASLTEIFASASATRQSDQEATIRNLHTKIGELTVEQEFVCAGSNAELGWHEARWYAQRAEAARLACLGPPRIGVDQQGRSGWRRPCGCPRVYWIPRCARAPQSQRQASTQAWAPNAPPVSRGRRERRCPVTAPLHRIAHSDRCRCIWHGVKNGNMTCPRTQGNFTPSVRPCVAGSLLSRHPIGTAIWIAPTTCREQEQSLEGLS